MRRFFSKLLSASTQRRELDIHPNTSTMQQEIVFWNNGNKPTHAERLWWVNPKNPSCPLGKFVGNPGAIKRLCRAAFTAFSRPNHSCADQAYAVIGPASTGKTTLIKLFAQTVKLPFVQVEAETLCRLEEQQRKGSIANGLLDQFRRVCKATKIGNRTLELKPQPDGGILLPSSIVFIDEVHNLKKNIVQGLLKAVEGNDCRMVTELGTVVNTRNICWIVATTELGDLFGPFVTRFTKIRLELYSRAEIAQIVKLNHPNLDNDVCAVVAHYCGLVPREAIGFAKEMMAEYDMHPASWESVASVVAEDRGIDPSGMTYQRLAVLRALGQGSVTINQLMLAAQCQEAELRKYVLPPLLATTPDQPVPLVTIGHRYTITPAGLAALDKRKIANRGMKAIPRNARSAFESFIQ